MQVSGNKHIREYTTKTGKKQYKPSLELLQQLDGEGFCLACGSTQEAEPDAQRYTCEACGQAKVYGNEELALMGLCF